MAFYEIKKKDPKVDRYTTNYYSLPSHKATRRTMLYFHYVIYVGLKSQ